jgi:AcrR family transcriptional regulator
MITEAQGSTAPTRDRILAAALELFAAGGYEGTSIGEIEAAAGLSPRSGALYKHFASKQALFEAALEERMAAIEAFNARLELTPLGDTRAELTLIGRWALAELARERQLLRMLMRDGGRVPALADHFAATIVRRGIEISISVLKRYAAERDAIVPDPEALGEVMCASLVGFSLQRTLFGDGAAGVDEDRFLAAWVDSCLTVIDTLERSPANA